MKPNTKQSKPTIIIIFNLFFLLYPLSFLFSDTIIDSVYSDPLLDGEIKFNQNSQSYSINNWMYDMLLGDTDDTAANPDPNSYLRSYISFDLPIIPENYYVDSVYVRLYQYQSYGYNLWTGQYTDFPVWNVSGGDTIKCIMSHIDYGNELDVGDWVKGDLGNPYTYHNNIGTITESGIDGYRYLDVTSGVIQDYELNRDKTQYRIAFQVDTDWDNGCDLVAFITSNSQAEWARPQVFIRFTNEINSIENDEIPIEQKLNIEIYPNPFNGEVTIEFSMVHSNNNLEIYNIKGQKVYSQMNLPAAGSIVWKCEAQTSGIYLIKISNSKQKYVKKIIYLK